VEVFKSVRHMRSQASKSLNATVHIPDRKLIDEFGWSCILTGGRLVRDIIDLQDDKDVLLY
jgi:hypothetical protein